jgi:Tol biopolymer transport system component/predicted Ser/Thr protein kinase
MIGTTIAHYTILEKLGEGGMGVVYKALDTKLDREVALKFLPPHLAASEKDRARFVQEAKAVATLNHPNICTIHDIGEQPDPQGNGVQMFIVMELVQGQTLQERKASLNLRQAVDIGIQVAEGLAAAHEKGIVHRDIKPENVMLRKDGIAQIMDFGLARVHGSRATRLTKEGSTVGTAGYMSPEQVQGQDTDHRSDIFSLGVLLYEMFTGRMPFQGVHETAILYEVVNVDPQPPSTVKPDLDPELDRIILECLQKDPDERYNAVKDVAKDLKRFKRESSRERTSRVTSVNREALRPGSQTAGSPAGAIAEGKSWTRFLWPGTAVVSLLLAAALAYLHFGRNATPAGEVTRFVLRVNDGRVLARNTGAVDISADGRNIALITVGANGANRHISVRRMDGLAERIVPGTEDAFDVSYSPDGEWLAFWSDGKLRKIPVRGGSATVLASAVTTRGIDWGDKNRIVYSPSAGSGIWLVSADGGEPRPVTELDSVAGEGSHRVAELLPGGDAVLFTIKTKNISTFSEAKIAVQRIDSKEKKVLIEGGSGARYLASGHLLYAQGPSLFLVPFDPVALELTGPAEMILDSAGMLIESFGYFTGAASGTGTLLYAPGGPLPVVKNQLTMFDRAGRVVPFLDIAGAFGPFSISADRKRVAAQLFAANDDIWTFDVERQLPTRFTFAGGNNWYPLWTPDGKNLVFTAEREGSPNLFIKSADGTGTEKRLARSPYRQWPRSFTPDGKTLLYEEGNKDANSDLWTLSLDGSRPPAPVLNSRFNEVQGVISPDGRWLAYCSNESGGPEVYVRPFPAGDGKWQISTSGGQDPKWTKGGREIVYLSSDRGITSVPVDYTGAFRPGRGSVLLRLAKDPTDVDVSPDGERITVSTFGDAVDIDRLVVVLNWFEELKRDRGTGK